ncbi:siderophore-interacting protein [Aeromicrobium sp. YIM 150415]|uniref:siderophore-interacting protein n=1 Tax=Aeromicrobium sp. YIM 150415 TaxID=2803912 RepID=UPI0019626FC3|nr:siderophore-interacting protein [Aeromicrobium sp. YIM 150415]MBM9464975.1 siderophore-interacting protein [Aeromicrobium sp. YIM 150415]
MAAERLASGRGRKPADARVHRARVLRREDVSPSFVRLTFGPDEPSAPFPLAPIGADQWFRLFFTADGSALHLPSGGADGWYVRLREMPDDERLTVRNYTARRVGHDEAGWWIEVDFLLHRDPEGQREGVAAQWAAAVTPGTEVGLLDQGAIFSWPDDAGAALIVTDATGLPGVEAALRELPEYAEVTVVADIPTEWDRRPLTSPAMVKERWAVHAAGNDWSDSMGDLDLEVDYVYAVDSSTLALDVRARALAAGVDSQRIDFCSYWRPPRV